MEGRDVIATAELLATINGDDELPFGGWNDGKGLDSRALARHLKPYDIRPMTVSLRGTDDARHYGDTPKGYRRRDFEDAWERYLPPSLSEAPQAPQAPHGGNPPHENPNESRLVADVADVADFAGIGDRVADRSATVATPERTLVATVPTDAELAVRTGAVRDSLGPAVPNEDEDPIVWDFSGVTAAHTS
jgi:hypothetical protein